MTFGEIELVCISSAHIEPWRWFVLWANFPLGWWLREFACSTNELRESDFMSGIQSSVSVWTRNGKHKHPESPAHSQREWLWQVALATSARHVPIVALRACGLRVAGILVLQCIPRVQILRPHILTFRCWQLTFLETLHKPFWNICRLDLTLEPLVCFWECSVTLVEGGV